MVTIFSLRILLLVLERVLICMAESLKAGLLLWAEYRSINVPGYRVDPWLAKKKKRAIVRNSYSCIMK